MRCVFLVREGSWGVTIENLKKKKRRKIDKNDREKKERKKN